MISKSIKSNVNIDVDHAGVGEVSALERFRSLVPEIETASAEGERARCLLPNVVEKLRAAGLFRTSLPRSRGGEEMPLAEIFQLMEELAMADAAAGWTAMVSFGSQFCLTRMSRQLSEMVLASGPDVMMRGALAPTGAAVPTEGGYLVSGRWPFASGPYDPEWVLGGCRVVDDSGNPKMGADESEGIAVLLRGDQVTFLDSWDTVGLRGTNSSDFVATDLFVPEAHVTPLAAFFGGAWPSSIDLPMFQLPFSTVTTPGHSAVVIGIAQAAVNELTELAKTKRRFGGKGTLAEDPVFCDRLGEITCRLAAMRELHKTLCAEIIAQVERGEQPTPIFNARNSSWLAYIHAGSVDLINDCFSLAGTTPVYSKSRLQQRWRDARCAAQHMANSTASYQDYGALLTSAPGSAPRIG